VEAAISGQELVLSSLGRESGTSDYSALTTGVENIISGMTRFSVERFLNIADDIFIGGALAAHAVTMPIAQNPKIILPKGDVTALDANPETLEMLKEKIKVAKFILWNGPLGNYEKGYKAGTLTLARVLADSGAKVIVGGGDTENVIDELGIEDKFYFISMAGGAMLDFLANGTLPGIQALK
jgi:3-phosphoglycerate kinase